MERILFASELVSPTALKYSTKNQNHTQEGVQKGLKQLYFSYHMESGIRSQIKKQILACFKDVPIPKTVSDGCPRQQCQEIEQKFQGRTRDSLSAAEIDQLSNEMILLNPQAFRYFFPAILLAALENIKSINFESFSENLIVYPGKYGYKNTTLDLAQTFSIAEADAILQTIEYWVSNPNIEAYIKEDFEKSLDFWRKKAKR